jgi:hypothetical protein
MSRKAPIRTSSPSGVPPEWAFAGKIPVKTAVISVIMPGYCCKGTRRVPPDPPRLSGMRPLRIIGSPCAP